MKWNKCSREVKWIPLNESFMDGLKSMWNKMKDTFKELPLSRLVGKDGKEVRGYVHDYRKSRKTCSIYVKDEFHENAAIASAVAASDSMGHSKGNDEREMDAPKSHVQQFKKGEKATLIGSDIGKNVPVTVIGYEDCGDLGIYELRLE